jgi:predicted amidophosphoribosyltransferase
MSLEPKCKCCGKHLSEDTRVKLCLECYQEVLKIGAEINKEGL